MHVGYGVNDHPMLLLLEEQDVGKSNTNDCLAEVPPRRPARKTPRSQSDGGNDRVDFLDEVRSQACLFCLVPSRRSGEFLDGARQPLDRCHRLVSPAST